MLAESDPNPPRRRPPYGIYAYTGREWDLEIGLYYYRNRYLHPRLGRFVSEDPIGFEGGINFFAYVGNSPVVYVDPDGMRATYRHGGARFHCRSRDWITTNNRGNAAPAVTVPTVITPCSCENVCGGYRRSIDISFSHDVYYACDAPNAAQYRAHEEKHVADMVKSMEGAWRAAEALDRKTFSSRIACEASCAAFQFNWNLDFRVRQFATESAWRFSKP